LNAPFPIHMTQDAHITPHIVSVALDEVDDQLVRALAAYVDNHEAATPFHRLEWVRAVAQGCGQDARYLVAFDAADNIIGALPLNLIHSPLFGRALVSSGFAVGGGILSDNHAATDALAHAMWEVAERESCPTAELRGGAFPSIDWNVEKDTYLGFETELAGNDEEQLLAIPRKQRAEVRKGLKNEMQVRVVHAEQDRADHYDVYAESVRNLGTPVFPRSLFDAVMDGFGEDADILTVYAESRPVASVLSLYHKGVVMPYWGGGTWDARRLRANDVMYYALMNHARERGCKHFDFGRSKAGTGAASFKKNWGFEGEPLSYAVRTADGETPRDVNPLSPQYRLKIAIWQRLPLAIANKLGPYIAKGLG